MGIVLSSCKAPNLLESASSKAEMKKIKTIIKDSITKKKSGTNIRVLNNQQISINQKYSEASAENDELMKYNYKCPRYSELPGLEIPMYGCAYDVSQKSNIKMLIIDETLMRNTSNILAKIDSEIQNTFPASGSDSKKGKPLNNPEIVKKVKNIFENYKMEKIVNDKGVLLINITKPIKCNYPCNGRRANPMISDNIILNQITDDIYDIITHNRDINYEDTEKISVGDNSLTPEKKKAKKTFCLIIAIFNIIFLFLCALVLCWLLTYVFDN